MGTVSRSLRLVYTVAEAAELLGIGRSTAYELVARGELSAVRIGHRRMVTRPTLTDLLGIEPPLPADLDAHRDAAISTAPTPALPLPSQPRPTSRPRRARPASPTLPFPPA